MDKDKRTFEELVDDMTKNAHSMLLTDGAEGLRAGVFIAMQQAIVWNEDKQKEEL